jgi:hypothetical protein
MHVEADRTVARSLLESAPRYRFAAPRTSRRSGASREQPARIEIERTRARTEAARVRTGGA